MIFLRYTWDHIEIEDFTNYLTPLEYKLPFAVNHIGNWKEGKDYYTKRQNPNDYYLLYTVSGSGKVFYRLNEAMLNPGDICLIDGSEIHSYKTENSEAWHTLWFHITGSGVKSYFDILNPDNSFNVISLPDLTYPFQFYSKAKNLIQNKNEQTPFLLCSEIVDFLNYIVMQTESDSKVISEQEKQLNDIKLYIENHMHTIITVSQICDHFEIALQQIEKLFLKYEKTELTEYIKNRYRIYQTRDNARISVDHPDWLLDAISYINENFNSDIQLKDIIKRYHISKALFIREFKQYTCMKPLEYLIHLRLKHGIHLLEKTDKKISAIASESGFPSASNFTSRFRQFTGMSPSEYKNSRITK